MAIKTTTTNNNNTNTNNTSNNYNKAQTLVLSSWHNY